MANHVAGLPTTSVGVDLQKSTPKEVNNMGGSWVFFENEVAPSQKHPCYPSLVSPKIDCNCNIPIILGYSIVWLPIYPFHSVDFEKKKLDPSEVPHLGTHPEPPDVLSPKEFHQARARSAQRSPSQHSMSRVVLMEMVERKIEA